MQSVSSRIWTRIVVSNSYDDNHYTTGTSKKPLVYADVKTSKSSSSSSSCSNNNDNNNDLY